MAILYEHKILGAAGVARVGGRATPDDLGSASPLTLREHLRNVWRISIKREREGNGALWLIP